MHSPAIMFKHRYVCVCAPVMDRSSFPAGRQESATGRRWTFSGRGGVDSCGRRRGREETFNLLCALRMRVNKSVIYVFARNDRRGNAPSEAASITNQFN